MRLLEGSVEDERDTRIRELENDVRDLHRRLLAAEGSAAAARREAGHALGGIRKQLTPLYRALQAVFGELDAAGVDEGGAAPDSRTDAIWQSWKSRLGPQCGKIIDALLLQPDMNTTQLAIAIGTNRNNIPSLIFKLNKAGLINKSGGRFSMKSL